MAMEQLRSLEESMNKGPKVKMLFQVSFYNFLKRLRDKEGIQPSEVLTALSVSPELSSFIFRQKYADFKNALRQLSHTDADRQVTYTCLLYDYYHQGRSFFCAAVKAGHYRLDKFDRKFVHNVFTQFPFLKTKAHLDRVSSLLDTYQYACLLIHNKISEVYNGTTIGLQ